MIKVAKRCAENLHLILVSCLSFVPVAVWAAEQTDKQIFNCMTEQLKTAKDQQTIGELRDLCVQQHETAIASRINYEAQAAENPFAILPHRPNYVLPLTLATVRDAAYRDFLQQRDFQQVEAKFQVSLKSIIVQDLLTRGLDLQLAYTSTSWWQAYNSAISAPFRETNYEPELILNYHRPWQFFSLPIQVSYLSLNHQSNGQAGVLSRSWNRIIAGVVFSTGALSWNLKSWYRIPEDPKDAPELARGDDNPDIARYLGYGEVGILWQFSESHNIDVLFKNNFRADNRGSVKVGWTFPLSHHLTGYVEYFNGYGESLIYYNQHLQRIGVGIKITDWL